MARHPKSGKAERPTEKIEEMPILWQNGMFKNKLRKLYYLMCEGFSIDWLHLWIVTLIIIFLSHMDIYCMTEKNISCLVAAVSSIV